MKYSGKFESLNDLSIEESLSERFACGINSKEVFISYTDISRIREKIFIENEAGRTNTANYRFYANVFTVQRQKLSRIHKIYENVLDRYNDNRDSNEAKTALYDLYIKTKYDEAVANLASEIAPEIQRTFDASKDRREFKKQLTKHPKYLELKEAYKKIGSKKARKDLVPKSYITSRLGNPELLKVIPDLEWKKRIIRREKDFYAKHLDEMVKSNKSKTQFAENQDHDYSWGVILDEPTFVINGVSVDNADFQGRISVKHLGFFTAEALFSKRKLLRERHEKISILKKAIMMNGKRFRIGFKKHIPNSNIPENMRDYYYRYVSTREAFDNIYLITKTNANGEVRNDIVFSPIGKNEFGTSYPENFLTNIYFSNYALNIAKQNGGFAGAIVHTPNGLAISTINNRDEIAAGILFNDRTIGKVIDRTKIATNNWKEMESSEVREILFSINNEKEKAIDE